jgi:TPR repeat protein
MKQRKRHGASTSPAVAIGALALLLAGLGAGLAALVGPGGSAAKRAEADRMAALGAAARSIGEKASDRARATPRSMPEAPRAVASTPVDRVAPSDAERPEPAQVPAGRPGRWAADAITASELERGCADGRPQSCGRLAELLATGTGVDKDAARSAALHERACNDGVASSCGQLGMLALQGGAVAKDDARALRLFNQACDARDGFGCLGLGRMYASGNQVEKDQARARELYGRACDAGSGFGCRVLALALRDGHGGPADAAASAAAARKGCQLGDRDACLLP